MSTKPHARISILLAVLFLTSLACQTVTRQFDRSTPTSLPEVPTTAFPEGEATVEPEPTVTEGLQATGTAEQTQPTQAVEISAEELYPPQFADYPAVTVKIPDKSPTKLTLPVDVNSLSNLSALEVSDQQRALLAKNGFAVAAPKPGEYREFYQVYEAFRYADTQPLFVTTDAIFHVYHLIFDKMLRDLERDQFIPTLQGLTSAMLKTSQEQKASLAGTPLEEPARRNAAFFAVAAQLLGLPDPVSDDIKAMVDAELALIEAHAGAALSPLWDRPDLPQDKKLIEDYGQYVPRGHYTRSEDLKRYFKAMMWYGRLTFRLRDTFETRRALALVQALRTAQTADGKPVSQQWETIYDPTVFIVGKSDDLSYHEYGAIIDKLFGNAADLTIFASDENVAKFVDVAKKLPPPQVNSMWVWIWEDPAEATQGFRFMGQRFTLDEYVFGQLIWRKVGDSAKPRMLPKGLDFFAALGSQEALTILDEMQETTYANYTQQMTKVQGEVANLGLDSWTQNLYWSWLYAFRPVIAEKDQRYPAFMRTQAWARKDLNTALGSWTELKHDTILYAKQVMAEMGGGPSEPPPPGYVEPNPEAFARLYALAQMTSKGLEQRGLLSDITRGNLENLSDLLLFLKNSAETELAGQDLQEQDYNRIRYIGGELEALTLAASDRDAVTHEYRDLSDQKAALVADVATGADPNGQLVALEEAIGQPAILYVVLPDHPDQVAVGAVFTYYEFTVNSADRMTDETWQTQVEQGTNPPAPQWTQSFVTP